LMINWEAASLPGYQYCTVSLKRN